MRHFHTAEQPEDTKMTVLCDDIAKTKDNHKEKSIEYRGTLATLSAATKTTK